MRRAIVPGLLAALLLLPARGADRAPERDQMIQEQIADRGLRDEKLLDALRRVPRHRFVPADLQGSAYDDRPLPIGHGQTISQPYIVAYMTDAARLTRDSRVLEIGTGSGYQAAVLAELCDRVFTVEIIPALARRAAATLRELGYTGVSVREGDGYEGWPEEAPFDVIIVTAAAESIPPPLLAQLKEGGRMIIPVGPQFGAQNLVLVTKHDGKARTRTLLPVRFVPFVRAKD